MTTKKDEKREVKESMRGLSLRKIAEASGVDYFKIRNSFIGSRYNSLDSKEKSAIMNVVFDEINPFLNKLGYFMQIKRLDTKDQYPDQ